MEQDRVGAVFVHAAMLTARERALPLAKLGLKHRLPTMFGNRDNVVAGGLMSYAPDYTDLTRRAAVYIDKILKGAKPGELPVEQASKFQLVINLKTARARPDDSDVDPRARRRGNRVEPVMSCFPAHNPAGSSVTLTV